MRHGQASPLPPRRPRRPLQARFDRKGGATTMAFRAPQRLRSHAVTYPRAPQAVRVIRLCRAGRVRRADLHLKRAAQREPGEQLQSIEASSTWRIPIMTSTCLLYIETERAARKPVRAGFPICECISRRARIRMARSCAAAAEAGTMLSVSPGMHGPWLHTMVPRTPGGIANVIPCDHHIEMFSKTNLKNPFVLSSLSPSLAGQGEAAQTVIARWQQAAVAISWRTAFRLIWNCFQCPTTAWWACTPFLAMTAIAIC